jgi:hypothetical protein
MLRDQGEPEQAHALLAPAYNWFSEGFDTVPLWRARALLDELEAADNPPRRLTKLDPGTKS